MSDNLKVLSTLAVELALKSDLLPAWETKGNKIEMAWNPTAVLINRIREGERGDVLIAIDEPMENLTREGILRAGSMRPMAQASFGLGSKSGSVLPDISTPEGFKQVLVSSRSIAFSLTGASGLHFQEVLDQLGVTDAVKARAVMIPAGFTAQKVISGEAEFAVQQISELMSIDGIDVVGPFPEPYQKHTDFSAAIFSDSKNPEAAARFIDYLSGEEAAAVFARSGLVPRVATAA